MSLTPTRQRSNAFSGCIRSGDILIKHSDGSAVNRGIVFGQLFGRGPSKFAHAGIASSATTIIEMAGDGLLEHNLLQENSAYKYDVFRCKVAEAAVGATEVARMMLEGFDALKQNGEGMKISYNLAGAKGAIRSISARSNLGDADVINNTLDKLLSTSGEAFFCSGHVVLCYQAALGQMAAQGTLPVQDAGKIFSLESHCYQPAYLWKKLKESTKFDFIGTAKGAQKV